MTVAWSTLSAIEQARAAADSPLIGSYLMTSDASQWRNGGSFAAGTDDTDSTTPGKWAHDGATDLPTKVDVATVTSYFMIDASSDPKDIDHACILGHNFGTTGGLTITLEVDDVNTFATAFTVATWTTPTDDARLASLSLFHTGSTAIRYLAVPYIRLKVTGTSAVHEIGELILGRRYNHEVKPNRPYNPNLLASNASTFTARSGNRDSFERRSGQRLLRAVNPVLSDADKVSIVAWWAALNYGANPFTWVENPGTTPGDVLLMMFGDDDRELQLNDLGPNRYDLVLDAAEQGPDFLAVDP